MKKYKKHIILVSSGIFLMFTLLLLTNRRFKDLVKFKIFHYDYVQWKNAGGPLREDFTALFNIDSNKNSMVIGLSYEDVIEKYPFLIKSEIYHEDSYKGSFVRYLKKENKDVRVLWFHKDDDFDWCILIYKDPSQNNLRVLKG